MQINLKVDSGNKEIKYIELNTDKSITLTFNSGDNTPTENIVLNKKEVHRILELIITLYS